MTTRSPNRLILFTFAGRQADMETQRPHVDLVMERHPEAEFHIWNFTRNTADDTYVRALHGGHGGRVIVRNDHHQGENTNTTCTRQRDCDCVNCRISPWREPWFEYATDAYAGTNFIKFDDDVIWWDDERFDNLLTALDHRPDRIWSANVANNPGCALRDPILSQAVKERWPGINARRWRALGNDTDFAALSHRHLLDNYDSIRDETGYVKAPNVAHVPINLIGIHHDNVKEFHRYDRWQMFHDEPFIHSLKRMWIIKSFRAAHLYYRLQKHGLPEEEWDQLRAEYATLGTSQPITKATTTKPSAPRKRASKPKTKTATKPATEPTAEAG